MRSLRRSRQLLSTDGESHSPSNEVRKHSASSSPITSCQFTEELEDSSSLEGSRVIDKGKGKEVDRGRRLERSPRFPNPLARAESRIRRDDADIEVDARPIEKRPSRSSTFFEDRSDPCAVLEDNLLEPCPHMSMCNSFSEVLNSPTDASTVEMLRPRAKTSSHVLAGEAAYERPARALTTLFSDCQPHSPAPTLTPEARSQIQPDICHLEFLALNSVLEGKSGPALPVNNRKVLGPPPSLAAGLPTEIIQQIFYNLHPADFNSARHTCRSWFINSLERSVLETMLRRGGWSACIPQGISSNHAPDEQDTVNEEWQMSKRISRECALGPAWTGNGFGGNECKSSIPSKHSAFVHTSTTDFTDVAVHYPGMNSSGTVFTVSSCRKFLMAANGCLIYIYELNKTYSPLEDGTSTNSGSLRPVTSILCPRRVLACSMDTSSHRYAIAVLLDGRMGLVCEISPSNITASSHSRNRSDCSEFNNLPGRSSSSGNPREGASRASFLDHISLNSSSTNLGSNRASSEPPFVLPGIAVTLPQDTTSALQDSSWQDVSQGHSPEMVRAEGPSSRHPSLPRAHILTPGCRLQSALPPDVPKAPSSSFMPIETGPRSLYRNLCSDDDPPRSVAICPQRRCVAFGCSAGIELHWVDALTGQDLNRWFPLTAPSDYLFFLPPRKSVDSAKKLRLISSAARPGERAAISERAFGGRTKNSPFWERLGWGAGLMDDEDIASQTQGMVSRLRNEVRSRGLSGRMDYSDHYRAIPLSDGYHILFTDPTTGLLCLGSDAPVGGPTKLLRKIWFQGPEGEGSPVSYASGSDLNFGVRVVAAFGSGIEQKVWFFVVPGDVFAANQSSQTMVRGPWLKSSSSYFTKNLEWMNWWPDDGLQEWINHSQDPVQGVLPRSVWPVKIKGQEIGALQGLVDLAIDSGPSMTIWAFSKEGMAKVWQIDDGKLDVSVTERLVARDGTIRELDGEGDVEMSDAPSSSPDILVPPLPLHPESFDGTASFQVSTVFTTRAERRHSRQCGEPSFDYDADGDVLMDDLPGSEDQGEPQGSLDEVTLAQAGLLVYETFQRSECIFLGRGPDFVEELTGISRLDIEIR